MSQPSGGRAQRARIARLERKNRPSKPTRVIIVSGNDPDPSDADDPRVFVIRIVPPTVGDLARGSPEDYETD